MNILRSLVHYCLLIALLALSSFFLSPAAVAMDFRDVLDKATEASRELQLTRLDEQLGTVELRSAHLDYLPNIRGRYNTEYLRDFQSGQQPVVSVGDMVIPAGTRFQNSIGLSVGLNLTDLPIVRRRVLAAEIEVNRRKVLTESARQELYLTLLELYRDALSQNTSLRIKRQILALAQKAFSAQSRLYEAGLITRIAITDQALQVAQTIDDIQRLEHQFQTSLDKLSFYTKEVYSIDSTELENFEGIGTDDVVSLPDVTHHPDILRLQLEARQKHQEAELLRFRYLPQVSWYVSYNLYGFDPDSLPASIANIGNRTIATGLSITLPTLDVVKNKVELERVHLEEEKLALQIQQKQEQLAHAALTAYKQMNAMTQEIQSKQGHLKFSQERLDMNRRLSEQELIDKLQPISDEITLLAKQSEIELEEIQREALIIRLKILAGTYQ
jgi:outer membrane protein TolC